MLQINTSCQLLFMHSTACFCMSLSVIACLYLLCLPTLPCYFMTLSATTYNPSFNCPAFITCLYLLLSALLSLTLSATTILPASFQTFIACPCLADSSSVCSPFYDTLCYYNTNCQLPVIAFNSLSLPLLPVTAGHRPSL
jgi:hypothetical protein